MDGLLGSTSTPLFHLLARTTLTSLCLCTVRYSAGHKNGDEDDHSTALLSLESKDSFSPLVRDRVSAVPRIEAVVAVALRTFVLPRRA